MRSDLQAILNAPAGSSTAPISKGQLPGDKLVVLTWLYLKLFSPNVNFNMNTVVGKATGMQGVTPDNMTDFQIEGLATYFGYSAYTWPQLVAVARGAIDGQGVSVGGLNKFLSSDDYQDLINYALLTATKVLSDAS